MSQIGMLHGNSDRTTSHDADSVAVNLTVILTDLRDTEEIRKVHFWVCPGRL